MNEPLQYKLCWNRYTRQATILREMLQDVTDLEFSGYCLLEQARVVDESLATFRQVVIKESGQAVDAWLDSSGNFK